MVVHEKSTVLRSIYIYLIRYLYLVLLCQYNIRMQNIAVLRSVDVFFRSERDAATVGPKTWMEIKEACFAFWCRKNHIHDWRANALVTTLSSDVGGAGLTQSSFITMAGTASASPSTCQPSFSSLHPLLVRFLNSFTWGGCRRAVWQDRDLWLGGANSHLSQFALSCKLCDVPAGGHRMMKLTASCEWPTKAG